MAVAHTILTTPKSQITLCKLLLPELRYKIFAKLLLQMENVLESEIYCDCFTTLLVTASKKVNLLA